MQLSKGITRLSMAILVSTIAGGSLLQSATALPQQETLVAQASRRRLNFRVGVRPSRYRVGGYSRSSCRTQPLPAALVPPLEKRESLFATRTSVDKTIAAHPVFFVHLPSLPPQTAQFTLKNESGTELYSTEFEITGKPGVVGIQLPDSAPALQVGRKYSWQVEVICIANEPSSLYTISSWVERVTAPKVSDDMLLTTLAEQGIWQDVVTLLATQRYQEPGDRAIAEDWAILMEDAGLSQFKRSQVLQIVKN
jgi:hypothetical protein